MAAVCLASTTTAGAEVTVVKGTAVGLQPRNETTLFDGPLAFDKELNGTELTSPNEFANSLGDPVVHGSAVYAVYWDPTYHYHDDWKEKIDEFLQKLGGASNSRDDFLAVDTQYTDKTNKPAYNRVTFRGAAEDTEAYPRAAAPILTRSKKRKFCTPTRSAASPISRCANSSSTSSPCTACPRG